MAKDRNIRKKTRFNPYKSWEGDCESFSDASRRQFAEEQVDPPRNRHIRKKKKLIFIMATAYGTPKWYMPKGAWRIGKYEKMRDAEKALETMQNKRWPGDFYELRIEDRRPESEKTA